MQTRHCRGLRVPGAATGRAPDRSCSDRSGRSSHKASPAAPPPSHAPSPRPSDARAAAPRAPPPPPGRSWGGDGSRGGVQRLMPAVRAARIAPRPCGARDAQGSVYPQADMRKPGRDQSTRRAKAWQGSVYQTRESLAGISLPAPRRGRRAQPLPAAPRQRPALPRPAPRLLPRAPARPGRPRPLVREEGQDVSG